MENLNYGNFYLSGSEYTDNICLAQNRNERRDDTGRMCVRDMPFLDITTINTINGGFSANGILGLAPNLKEKSFID